MKKNRDMSVIREYFHRSRLLTEAPDDEDEDAKDDADQEGDDNSDEPDIAVTDEEEESLDKSIDDEIQSFMVNAEEKALKSAKVQQQESMLSLKRLLFEETDDEDQESKLDSENFDVEVYSSEVARLVKNYDTLMDIPRIILTKATEFIRDKYDDKDLEERFEDILMSRYDLTLQDDREADVPPDAPLAVGAVGGGTLSGTGGGASLGATE